MTIPTESLAVLSTGHLPEEEAQQIPLAIDDGEIVGMSRDEGWLIHAYATRANLPTLNFVLGYLRAKGFDWVLFDRDAAGSDELEEYIW